MRWTDQSSSLTSLRLNSAKGRATELSLISAMELDEKQNMNTQRIIHYGMCFIILSGSPLSSQVFLFIHGIFLW